MSKYNDMKQYIKILEAINRGINLALDNIEDQLNDIQLLTHSKIKSKNYTKEYLDLMTNYVVDLGLPSGTLWCKYNLGVELDDTFNPIDEVGIGDYYAWGEIEPNKPIYDLNTYKYSGVSVYCEKMTKYCTDKNAGVKRIENNENYPYTQFMDNLTLLLPEDDAATQNMHIGNFKFCIPTKDLFRELLYNTNAIWKNIRKDFSIYRCIELTSKINGNKIVFPACGHYIDNKCKNIGFVGQYWSSNINTHINNMAVALNFEDTRVKTIIEMKELYRCIGLQIRPVINLN